MERLTERYEEYAANFPKELKGNRKKYPMNSGIIYEKLGYYEDLEEQGLLLKLPCKVGDTVYAIEASEEEFEHFHCGLKISKCEFDFWIIPLFGKCVFLTQAEAEEALRRMEKTDFPN